MPKSKPLTPQTDKKAHGIADAKLKYWVSL